MDTIGADPELFIRDSTTGGVITICGLVGGTKEEPLPLPGMPPGYAVQEDNVMLEFNIPPCTSAREFSEAIKVGLRESISLVCTRSPDAVMDFASYRAFTEEQLNVPEANQFGCSMDFDAYKGGQPCRRLSPRSLVRDNGTAWRFAGGHVHLGFQSDVPNHVTAQFADVFLGLPSVELDRQGPRRSKYGTAGRYRPTDYGIEYRTLSNFWIFDEGLSRSIGAKALRLCEFMADEDMVHQVFNEVPWMDVKSAISKEDENLAADLIAYISTDLNVRI